MVLMSYSDLLVRACAKRELDSSTAVEGRADQVSGAFACRDGLDSQFDAGRLANEEPPVSRVTFQVSPKSSRLRRRPR
jgi:hypothetical protein